MEIFAFANQKGGVGKSTLAVHLAIRAQQTGCHTLLVDLDQQGSATYLCTGNVRRHQEPGPSALDLWFPHRDISPIESRYGFDLLPASVGLDKIDDDFDKATAALNRLRKETDYNVVVMDCPPAVGVRQLAPFAVANTHVIPITPDTLGTQGIAQTLQLHVAKIVKMNPRLKLQILINRLKANSPTNKAIATELEKKLGDNMLPYRLFEREDVRRALGEKKPYWDVCKDTQADEWRGAFDSLLDGVPGIEDGPEVEEPGNADMEEMG